MLDHPMKCFLLLTCFSIIVRCVPAQSTIVTPAIGIAQDYHQDSLLSASGYAHLVESVSKCLSPLKLSDDEFSARVETFKGLKVPVYAVNIFMPAELKLVGSVIKEEEILAYARTVFERCRRIGVTMVVWGSGGARRVPQGFDEKTATKQFVHIAKKVSSIAAEFGVRLALENLNSTETNFIVTVAEALRVVKLVDHPNFRLCADIYHMLKEGEQADILLQSGRYLIHCDIAERDDRSAPGVKGDDFTSYLEALRKIKYSGIIVLECRWSDIKSQALPARLSLQRQLDQVYAH
jgi:sugar phosphate isomerase/epimerase